MFSLVENQKKNPSSRTSLKIVGLVIYKKTGMVLRQMCYFLGLILVLHERVTIRVGVCVCIVYGCVCICMYICMCVCMCVAGIDSNEVEWSAGIPRHTGENAFTIRPGKICS